MIRRPRSRAIVAAGIVLLAACRPATEQSESVVDQPERAVADPALPSNAAPADAITCSYPVGAGDTLASLQSRYGQQAQAATLGGPEGSEFEGVVLWPDDPSRRLEVIFADDAMREVSSVHPGDGSRWRIAGLALGDPLARARDANGRRFTLWGFEWDYGGYVSDLDGGSLASQPGGCRVLLRFGPGGRGPLPEGVVGEVELSSDDPRLDAVDPRIEELSLGFLARQP